MPQRSPIVVVEDDLDDQFLLKEIFERLKVSNELKFFRNGVDALDYLKTTSQHTFIILCDINMPLMNGLELRKRIAEDNYLKRKGIPFIFLTTNAVPSEVRQVNEFTIQGFFTKQTDFRKFESLLKNIIDYWKKCERPTA